MRKPSTVVYGVEERPPLGVSLLSGLQHVGLMSMYLLYPVLVAKAANASPEVAASMVSVTLLTLAVGTILQGIPLGPFGSGYLSPPVPSIVYFVPSLLAAKAGGIALVFGMTMVAGLSEMALSRALRRLRPVFPPEIVGLVILLVGLASGFVGVRLAFGDGRTGPLDPIEGVVGIVTLALMIGLNVWGRGALRISCVLIGMVVGYVTATLLGGLSAKDVEVMAHAEAFAFPSLRHVSWAFDPHFIVAFLVGAIAATLKVIGNVTTAHKASDADWVRSDMRKVSRGVLADGLTTTIAGAVGAHGLNSSTPNVGLATATGVLSRRISYPIAAVLVLLAFLPKLGAFFYLMPRMVAASALLFASTFIVVNGIQVMTSRLLDSRRTLIIGLALVAGLAVDAQPAILRLIPDDWKPVLGTPLVLGTLLALGLNLLFRLGTRRTQEMTVPLGPIDAPRVEEFLQKAGESWGARPDVIGRAKFNLVQSIETILEGCDPEGPLEVHASFDEYHVVIGVDYRGPLLELPEARPTNDEIMETDEGHRRLAGFMLRRYADRVSSTHKAGLSTVTFTFDH